jgi:hypothetical protein
MEIPGVNCYLPPCNSRKANKDIDRPQYIDYNKNNIKSRGCVMVIPQELYTEIDKVLTDDYPGGEAHALVDLSRISNPGGALIAAGEENASMDLLGISDKEIAEIVQDAGDGGAEDEVDMKIDEIIKDVDKCCEEQKVNCDILDLGCQGKVNAGQEACHKNDFFGLKCLFRLGFVTESMRKKLPIARKDYSRETLLTLGFTALNVKKRIYFPKGFNFPKSETKDEKNKRIDGARYFLDELLETNGYYDWSLGTEYYQDAVLLACIKYGVYSVYDINQVVYKVNTEYIPEKNKERQRKREDWDQKNRERKKEGLEKEPYPPGYRKLNNLKYLGSQMFDDDAQR